MSEENSPTINYHLRTVPFSEITFKWTIENISEFLHSGRSLNEDCKFSTLTGNLNLSTNSGAFIFKVEMPFAYDCTVVFCTTSKEELHKECKRSVKLNDGAKTACVEVELPEKLPNNTLVISCNLTSSQTKTFKYYLNPRKYLKWLRTSLEGHSRAFLKEMVYLRIDKNIEPIHKAILCENSVIFKEMFKSEVFTEASSNVIDIKDIKYPVLKNMTHFLNSGTVLNSDFESVCSLYCAANKYEISELKIACRELLEFKISIETVCSVLSLSNRHSDEKLMVGAIAYFKNNVTKVVSTVHWQNLMRDDIELGLELIGTM